MNGALMRLAPGYSNEDDNNIWLMNAILAILFDLIITDSIRPFFTLFLHGKLGLAGCGTYLFDSASVSSFIEKNSV